MGVALILLVVLFAVNNTVRLFHHVRLEEAATQLVREAARTTPPPEMMITEDFLNGAGDPVGTAEFTWDTSHASVLLTLNSSGLTARRQLPRESP